MKYNAIKQKIILLTKTPFTQKLYRLMSLLMSQSKNLLIIGILILLFTSRIISSSNENEITVNLTDPTESNIVSSTNKPTQNTTQNTISSIIEPEPQSVTEHVAVTESVLNNEVQLVYSQELDKTFDITAFSKLTKDELMTFPGIGEVTAQKILDYVAEFGAFQNFEELMEVKGIGEKKLQKILATFP